LEREPTNPHDENAVRMIGTYQDAQGSTLRSMIGYLPREIAAEIADDDISRFWPEIRFIKFPEPGPDPRFALRYDLMERKQ